METRQLLVPQLGRHVQVRDDTDDRQVAADTFAGLYHLPPDDMPAPRTVLDLGANIGLTAAHYQRLWPDAEIVAVEMDGDCCWLAEKNATGVKVRWHAVVGGTEPAVVYDPRVPTAAMRARPFRDRHPGDMTVRAYTLRKTILRSFEEPHIVDFVKMDVEGAEWEILGRGHGWASLVRHLLVELHDHGAPDRVTPPPWAVGRDGPSRLATEAIRMLEALGFEAVPHDRHPQAVWATR